MRSWYEQSIEEAGKGKGESGPFEESNDFFSGLYWLEQVPKDYLICDEALLPPESLRFFYVDENWVTALIAGALSAGRNCRMDFHQERAWQKGIRESLCPARGKKKEQEKRTGFLLRSSLLKCWPQTEFHCYPDETGTGRELQILRSAQLGEDTRLFLTDGVIRRVEFVEPTDGLSFGFTVDEKGNLKLPFYPLPPVEMITEGAVFERRPGDGPFLSVPFRTGGAKGVVDIQGLARELAQALGTGGEARDISALEMAAELLMTPLKYTLRGGML